MRELKAGLLLSGLLVLAACAGEDKGGEGEGDDEPMITGTISPTDEDFSGEVSIMRAFGFDAGGKVFIFSSSNADATCDNSYEMLISSDPYDPVDIFEPGFCNFTVAVPSGYEGEVQVTDDLLSITPAFQCPMGDGAFEYTDILDDGNTEKDYYWIPSDQYWTGVPHSFDITVSGSGEDGYTVDATMSSFEGEFAQTGSIDPAPASGNVGGTMDVEYCSKFGTIGIF